MIWLATLCLASTPDAGAATQNSGIVEYGASRAGESFGLGAKHRRPTRSRLDVSSPDLAVRGELSLAPIRVVAEQWHTRIDECAKDKLDRAFVVELDVDRDGFVTRGAATSAVADPVFDQCVSRLLREWLFVQSKTKKPSHIHLPLTLAPTAAP